MAKPTAAFVCTDCRQPVPRWVGRCPGCGAWGTIAEIAAARASASTSPVKVVPLGQSHAQQPRIPTGLPGIDRVLGGGLVQGSVTLLAGEPGIGKSTLLLQILAGLSGTARTCLLASGEESQAQVSARARRLGISAERVTFTSGRELPLVVEAARTSRPDLLAVDSIQTLRDPEGSQMPGGPSQVRLCADALVGLAKEDGIAVILTGHVTKDGELAGPRTLEHAVDVVLSFDGDPRSGMRILAAGKNRFGAEGEQAWFEMRSDGLHEIDPTSLLISGDRVPGAAIALPQSGRRALAVEIQALVGASEGPPRRQTTGLDSRRFQLVAAILDHALGGPFSRSELYGASSGGVRVDDPACDLAVAAALTSAATGALAPAGSAFVGEVSLTGQVRPAPAMNQRLAAAKAGGCTVVFTSGVEHPPAGLRIVPIRQVSDALRWGLGHGENLVSDRPA